MKILLVCIILGACSCLHAQGTDVGRSDPPYVDATVTMPTKFLNDKEKRLDMVSDLAEKSEMNYRLLGMKVMEKWQSSIKADKSFLKNIMKFKKVAFTVQTDGNIVIKGIDDKPAADKPATDKKVSQ
jgi:hypothetical protein